jgi:tetratricopeptide (TPR) repeat protein
MFALRRLLPLLAIALPAAALAQAPAPFSPDTYGLVYDLPGTRDVTLHADVPYLVVGRDTLTLDIYVPPGLKAREARGAVLFVNGIGDRRPDRVKRWAIYSTWPRVVAASGLIGISMDASPDSVMRSIESAMAFITSARGARFGVDTSKLAIYAASANVRAALDYLGSASRSPALRAAALFYGNPPTGRVPGVPTLFIVAQGDVPGLRPALEPLWRSVVDSAAPWTLVFGRDMPHAFDALTDSDDSRRLIRQTLDFWHNHLDPLPRFAPRATESVAGRRIVESFFAHRPGRSVELLRAWIAEHPRDAVAHERLGASLVATARPGEAEQAYRQALAIDSGFAAAHAGLGGLYLSTSRWADAAGALERAIALGQETSLIRGQLAYAFLALGRNEEGARSYERALALGVPPGQARATAAYNLACAYARLGRADDAFRMLDVAVENGLAQRAQVENDEDLAPLRGDPRYQRLLERLTS